MFKPKFKLSSLGQEHFGKPRRNKAGRIRTSFFQESILIFAFLHGRYEPAEFKNFVAAFDILATPDREQMRTREYFEWKHYVDAAKQQLLKKQLLVPIGNGRFVIPTGKIAEAFSRVSDFLEARCLVVVDDSSAMRDLMKHLITGWFSDVAVLSFQDGEAAWRHLSQKDPDVLITDMQRPSMSGWDMLPLLAKRKVKYPIVLVTGYGKEKDPEDGKTLQDVQEMLRRLRPTLNVTILSKPFDNETLREVLQRFLPG
jgi:CheY-like chemotaxis protein